MYSFAKINMSNVKLKTKPTSVYSDKDLYRGIKVNKDFGLQILKLVTKTNLAKAKINLTKAKINRFESMLEETLKK